MYRRVLGEADRLAVAVASQITAKCMAGVADHQDRTLLLRYLGQLGMTPSERTKIAVPKDKPKNPFDDDELPKAGKRKLIPGTRILAAID